LDKQSGQKLLQLARACGRQRAKNDMEWSGNNWRVDIGGTPKRQKQYKRNMAQLWFRDGRSRQWLIMPNILRKVLKLRVVPYPQAQFFSSRIADTLLGGIRLLAAARQTHINPLPAYLGIPLFAMMREPLMAMFVLRKCSSAWPQPHAPQLAKSGIVERCDRWQSGRAQWRASPA
jgi:hypothetical protein